MKQRKLYTVTLSLGLMALALVGFANHRLLSFLFDGMAGLLLVMSLPAAASRWNPLTMRINPKLALLVISVFVSVLIVEAILQVFFFNYFPPLTGGYRNAFDSTLGWFPVPNDRATGNGPSFANNSMGLRGGEFQQTGKVGIMFLGDSFVWGHSIPAVEERFTEKIQARHPEWNIYNVGVVGYGTDQEFLLLQRVFDRLKPRIVFLVFCTENDHENNSASFCFSCYKPHFTTHTAGLQLHGIPVPCSENMYYAAHPLLSRSHLFRLVVRVWKKFTLPPGSVHNDPTPALILEMRKYLQDKGSYFIVGLTAPDPEIELLLQRAGIPSVDLNTDYRIPGDSIGHWTTQGHSFAAVRIEKFLLTNSVTSHLLP